MLEKLDDKKTSVPGSEPKGRVLTRAEIRRKAVRMIEIAERYEQATPNQLYPEAVRSPYTARAAMARAVELGLRAAAGEIETAKIALPGIPGYLEVDFRR